MSTREIASFLSIFPAEDKDKKPTDPIQTEIQAGNVFYKHVTTRRTIYSWDSNNSGTTAIIIKLQPWKQGLLIPDDDDLVSHSFIGNQNILGCIYPLDPPAASINVFDYKKFRQTGLTTTIASTLIPRVIGSVGAMDQLPGSGTTNWFDGDHVISINDVPAEYTQIGIVYQHPMVAGGADVSTTLGANYVSYADLHYFDYKHTESHVHSIVRIHSGADAGFYFVRFADFVNNRLYLLNLDGSLFVGQATASTLTWSIGAGRRAYFNEVSVIQLSAGTVVTGGTFRPGTARNSFIMRVVFDKTGSDATAVGPPNQQGSYYVTLKPYTHGEGLSSTGAAASGRDTGSPFDTALFSLGGAAVSGVNVFTGGTNGYALDEPNQRVWFGYTNNSNQSGICHWRWKTVEGFREVANYLGTATHASFLTPSLVLGAGDIIRDLRIGPAGVTYVSIGHASAGNGGIAVIRPDLTTNQYTTASGVPSSLLGGSALDSTRARVGTSGDVTTTVSTDQVNSTSGAFTAADIGRVIVITGGTNNAGTYKISTVPSGTQVTVVTLANAAVSFGSGGTGGSFEIGERLYMFFTSGTTGAGKINYMESLALGTFLTRTVTMTNGASCNTPGLYGELSKISIDPANGNIYWLSNDTQQQINKYNVAANSHSLITIANVQSPIGGTGTISTITVFTAIHVNSKFDEIWVGTDFHHVKIVKSTFAAATAKRYFGTNNTTYANPPGFLRPGGDVSTTLQKRVRSYNELPDGKMLAMLVDIDPLAWASYSREADVWVFKDQVSIYHLGQNDFVPSAVFDSIGNFFFTMPANKDNANGQVMIAFGSVELQYQWNNANTKWIPLEVSQSVLPNIDVSDNFAPGCKSKPIHAALEDVLYGVKIGFTKVAGSANNQFLGRGGLSIINTDGSTAEGSTTFTGSGFVAGDVGKTLRLNSDPSTGIFTFSANPANADTITIDQKTYTFQTTLTNVDGNVKIAATAALTRDNFTYAINNTGGVSGTDYAAATTAHPTVTALITTGNTMKATAITAGPAGNLIATYRTWATPANGFWGQSSTLISATLGGSVYRISAFTSSTAITLKKMDWSSFTPATGSSKSYSVWDFGNPGTNAGPETATVLLADGFGKDNTQDISGISYENFQFKTVIQENVEPMKFCVTNPLPAPGGGLGMKVYFDFFARTAVNLTSGDLATTQIRALPAAEHLAGGYDGSKLVDSFVDGHMDGSNGGYPSETANSNRGIMQSSPSNANIWYGTVSSDGFGFLNPISSNLGCCPMVDLGADAEVGFVIIRGRTVSTNYMVATATYHGLKATLYKASNSGGTPVAAVGAGARTSGTSNLNLTANNNTISLSSGDFLGAIRASGGPNSDGSVTAGLNTFNAPTSTFVQADIGRALKITSVGDVGSYRIIAVDGTGAIATVQNLNQTAKAWTGTASSIVYEIRDAVREEDVICSNATSSGTAISSPLQRLCIERLLTSTTAQVRVAPHSTVTAQHWQCAVPTWDKVKRVSHNTESLPPDVKSNGTWISQDGREQLDTFDFKVYMDLSSLSVAQRTGRWWQMQMMPRGTNASSGNFWFGNFEFYTPTGARIGAHRYNFSDNALDNVDFMSQHINRADFIQASDTAMTGVAGFNGTVDLGGANGDTLTLTTGANKFLGFQVRRPYTDGVSTVSTSNFTSATAVFLTSDVGRTLRVQTGADAGYYRIATRTSGTVVTVTTPSGGAVSFAGATGASFSIHEGIAVGGSSPDRIVFLGGTFATASTVAGTKNITTPSNFFVATDVGKNVVVETGADAGTYKIASVVTARLVMVIKSANFAGTASIQIHTVDELTRDYTLATINDALTTITISESRQGISVVGKSWEIRRPAFDTSSGSVDSTKLARLVRPQTTYPLQVGDIAHDSRGALRFWIDDIGNGNSRSDGAIAGGNGVITGSGFCSDDVGRLLYLSTGTAANQGVWRISVFTSATSITVVNAYTGAAVSFTADAAADKVYKIFGDRRFKITRHVTTLRA